MENFIKTKSDDAILTIVGNEMYVSNNFEVAEDDNDNTEITFQIYNNGKSIDICRSGYAPVTVSGIQLEVFKQFINNFY